MFLNLPQTLERLRTRDRVPSPPSAQHKLIKTALKHAGLPVVFYKLRRGISTIPDISKNLGDYGEYGGYEKIIFVGNAPNDSFYEDGTLFVGPDDQKKREGGLWHELCHAMVASARGKLGTPNFDADENEEILTCQIEFWLGFVSGYYSYKNLTKLINYYSFDEEPIKRTDLYLRARAPIESWMTPASVQRFLLECRKAAQSVPMAVSVAKALGLDGTDAIQNRMRAPLSKYTKKHIENLRKTLYDA